MTFKQYRESLGMSQTELAVCLDCSKRDVEEWDHGRDPPAVVMKYLELRSLVVEWWREHECDTYWDGEDERNMFDDTPRFVEVVK